MKGWGTRAALLQARKTCGPDCIGYHATWPLVTRLGLKASPRWHHDFYKQHLTIPTDLPYRPRVLIAGAADHGALATVAAFFPNGWPEIEVVDRCETPIAATNNWASWHAVRGLWTYHQSIEDFDPGEGVLYEAIVCDGLLSLLPDAHARHQILAQLAGLLRPFGRFLYTTRLTSNGRPLEYDTAGRLLQSAASLAWPRQRPTGRFRVAYRQWRRPARAAPYTDVDQLRSDLEQHFVDVEIDVDEQPPTRALRLHRRVLRRSGSRVVRASATTPTGAPL